MSPRLKASMMADVESYAEVFYTKYCESVGGKAFNGDPLPTWKDFVADPRKRLQASAYLTAAAALAAKIFERYPSGEHYLKFDAKDFFNAKDFTSRY